MELAPWFSYTSNEKVELQLTHFSFAWYEDIVKALEFNNKRELNKRCIPQELVKKMNELIEFNLRDIGIDNYEIISDDRRISSQELQDKWVKYIMSINDLWNINIEAIDIFTRTLWYFSKSSLGSKHNLPYVLLFCGEEVKNTLEQVKWKIRSVIL